MGFLFSSPKKVQASPVIKESKIQNVDMIKVKLKHVRDKIKQYINLKTKQEESVTIKIKELVPEYQATGSKKKMMPYLSTKKDIRMAIEKAQIQLKLILDSLNDVEVSELNKQTIDAVEESNKHIDMIMREMQAKDWQNVIYQAQKKYELDWPQDEEDLENDPTFQQLWKQMGGDKLDDVQAQERINKKQVEQKKVHVEISHQQQRHHQNKKQVQFA